MLNYLFDEVSDDTMRDGLPNEEKFYDMPNSEFVTDRRDGQ